MDQTRLAILVTVLFSVVGVIGDYFLKLASETERPFRSVRFAIGLVVYSSTAFGWLYVMRYLKLGTISVVYSVSMILLLTAIGVLVFGEKLNRYEVLGMLLAVSSLVLLSRFSE